MDPISQNQSQAPKSGKKGIIAGLIAGLMIIGGFFVYNKNVGNQSAMTTPTDTANSGTDTTLTTTPVITNTKYKDGTYTADGSYQSPGGTETIKVTLVLKDDVITDATVVFVVAKRDESVTYQQKFISGYKQYVIGKNIGEVNVGKVSGSSLTPIGFNAAVTKIKAQAQA